MKNLYKRIRYYLIEMPDSKRDIETDVRQSTDRLNEHLLKCLLIQDTTNTLNHWSKEVWAFLHRVSTLKGTNKLPSEKMLYNCTINHFKDTFIQELDYEVSSINYMENTNIAEYNKQALYDCVTNYYKWLIPILSKNGYVDLQDVIDQVGKLIQEYNISNTERKEKVGV